MKELIDVYFFYWFIPLCILIIFSIYWDMFLSDQRKPKYRRDKEGYIQFYYRRYSWWINFPIWVEKSEEREIQVLDKYRNIDYTLSYIGPGRAKLKLNFKCEPVSQKYITGYMRKLYPEFKNSKQLWQLHNLYVDKEIIILNDIVKNNTFKAYERNDKY